MMAEEGVQKQLRRDLAKAKEQEQNMQLEFDQQGLILHSLQCELKTLKEVYETLQRELEKRQIKLTENIGIKTNYDKEIEENKHSLSQLESLLTERDA